jgi:AcrR family transcriptional regulator
MGSRLTGADPPFGNKLPMSSHRPYGEEANQKILEAAVSLFSERGLNDVSMDDIARAAGVSRASVFNHFGSKAMLLDAITARSLTAYRDILARALEDDVTPTPVLLEGLYASLARGLETSRALYRELFPEIRKVSLGLERDGEAPQLRREAIANLTRILDRGQRRGDLSARYEAAALTIAFDSLLSGAVASWLQDSSGQALEPLLADLCRMFLKGAAARP